MKKMILKYRGVDSHDRPVYVHEGKLFVDVDPVESCEPKICTKYLNAFDAEPDTPIMYIDKYKDAEIEFVPERITWKKEGKK